MGALRINRGRSLEGCETRGALQINGGRSLGVYRGPNVPPSFAAWKLDYLVVLDWHSRSGPSDTHLPDDFADS